MVVFKFFLAYFNFILLRSVLEKYWKVQSCCFQLHGANWPCARGKQGPAVAPCSTPHYLYLDKNGRVVITCQSEGCRPTMYPAAADLTSCYWSQVSFSLLLEYSLTLINPEDHYRW